MAFLVPEGLVETTYARYWARGFGWSLNYLQLLGGGSRVATEEEVPERVKAEGRRLRDVWEATGEWGPVEDAWTHSPPAVGSACPELVNDAPCGGTIFLSAGPGRIRHHRGVRVVVPLEMSFARCPVCCREWRSDAEEQALKRSFEEQRRRPVRRR